MRQGGCDTDALETAREPVEVLAQPEWPSAEHGHHFVDSIAEQKRAVERRDPRLAQGQIFAVQMANGQRHAQANQSRTVSTSRRHQPPAATFVEGCRGSVASV